METKIENTQTEKTPSEQRADAYANCLEVTFPANSTELISVDEAVKYYNRYKAIGNEEVANYLQGEIARATRHIKELFPDA